MTRMRVSLVLAAVVLALMFAWSVPAYADTATTSLPDLVITSIVFDPPSPDKGAPLRAIVTVKNQGQAQAIFRADYRIFSVTPFGNELRSSTDFVLKAGESKVFTVNLLPYNNVSVSGSNTFQFVVDPDNLIAEAQENNNTAAKTVNINAQTAEPPKAALKIDSLQIAPSAVNTKTTLNFTMNIKNIGTAAGNIAYVYLDGTLFGISLTNDTPLPVSIAPGQTFQYRGHTPTNTVLPSGLQLFRIGIYSPNSNLYYDSKQFQVEVIDPAIGSVGLPALYIENCALSRNPVKFGEAAYIKFYIANKGDGLAFFPAGSLVFNYRESGSVIHAEPITYDLVFKTGTTNEWGRGILNLPPGKHTITVTLDPNNVVKEKDENHHQATVTVDVIGPDMAVTGVAATPASPSTRSSIKLEIKVKNLGAMKWTFTGGAPFLSYGAQGRTAHKLPAPAGVELAPGQEYTAAVTIPAFTNTAGNYNIIVTVDQPGDPNPANNAFTLPVTLTLPSVQELMGGNPSQNNSPPTTLKNPLPPEKKIPPSTAGPGPGPSLPGR